MSEQTILNCCIFDGENISESTKTIIKDGKILSEFFQHKNKDNNNYFLMPGLIDAHTHVSFRNQLTKMRKNGVTGSCSISTPNSIKQKNGYPRIWSSYSMALGGINNAKAYVENEISHGADYIKVLLEKPPRMTFQTIKNNVFCDIVKYAHENNLKVAVHAVTVETVEMAVHANADILIHVPLEEPLPVSLAKQISSQKMAVVPTLVMMKAFTKSWRFGYKKEDYNNAEISVQRLYDLKVPILTGTDANSTIFVPKISYGTSLHKEMELLVKSGMTPLEVLKGATSNVAKVFDLKGIGTLLSDNKVDMVLIDGRPDQCISDIKKIKSVWIDGIFMEFG